MKRKLLKQMANQWRSNVWLVVELLIVSVVMWYIIDFLTIMIKPMTEPNGFDIEHCYKISFNRAGEFPEGAEETTSVQERRQLLDRLRHYPGVEAVALSIQGVEPYHGNFASCYVVDVTADSLYYGTRRPSTRYGYANADFLKVFRIGGMRGESPEEVAEQFGSDGANILVARNFVNSVDTVAQSGPVDPISLIGHKMLVNGQNYKLVNVVNDVKREDTTPLDYYSFVLMPLIESVDQHIEYFDDLSIRVRPEADNGFIERFRADISKQFHIGLTYVVDIRSFDDVRAERISEDSKVKLKLYVVLAFLLVNVFLGLLGTFWYRTRQRVSEMAVRMAAGATRASIFRRLMGEGIILLVIATVLAFGIDSLIAYLEFNLRMDGPHFTVGMMAWTVGMTFLACLAMITLGIYFPARAAMKIQPAEALHDE